MNWSSEDGVAQLVEHWTSDLAARVRPPVGEEPTDLMCAFLHVQMESYCAGLSVCNCRHTGKWCGTIKAVENTDHTRQTWIHLQTPLSPFTGCGPVVEWTSGNVLNWTIRSLNHLHHHHSMNYIRRSIIRRLSSFNVIFSINYQFCHICISLENISWIIKS